MAAGPFQIGPLFLGGISLPRDRHPRGIECLKVPLLPVVEMFPEPNGFSIGVYPQRFAEFLGG
jgi:hypothetical protein